MTMGAGDVTMLGKEIIAALQVKANRSAPGRPGDGVAMTEPTEREAPEAAAEAQPALPPAAESDFEGPRRRARREREERRAAQARATAIENARREAKRRALGKPPRKPKGLAAARFGV